MPKTKDKFEMWAIVELLGHRKLAGRVTEEVIAGASLVRVDVPDVPGDAHGEAIAGYTQFYGAASLYCLSPVTEEIARQYARAVRSQPVQRYELPALRRPAIANGAEDPEDSDRL